MVQPQPADDWDDFEDSLVAPEVQQAVLDANFDLQLLPGVTPSIERGLKAAGLDSPNAILKAGVAGLTQVKFVGESKAEAIYTYVKERYGDAS